MFVNRCTAGVTRFTLDVYARVRMVVRLKAHDTLTEHGRSRERYRRMALTTMASFASRAISLIASLISIPLTFRYLGAERYGLWMVLISIISVMGFADLGIGNGVMNAVSKAYGEDDCDLAREYVTSGFFLMLGIAAILAVTGTAAYPFVPWLRLFNVKSAAVASEGAKAFAVLFCWFVLNIPLDVVTRVQAGLQQGYWSHIVGACGNIVSLLALLLVIVLRGSLPWLVFASTFGVITATVLNGFVLFRKHPWLLPSLSAYRGSSANKILKLGMLFFVLQCAVAVGYTSDNVVIAQILGAAAVAVYAVPQKLFNFVAMLVAMGLTPLWPAYGEAVARGDVAWVRRVFWGSMRITLAITIPLCTFLALVGPWIVRVAVGKSLQTPPMLLPVLALWGVISAVSTTIAMLLNGAGILRVQACMAVVASLSNLALSIYFTRRLGVMGVCLGSIISQLLITFPVCFWAIRTMFKKMANQKMESGLQQGAYSR